jgi:hypothetical protein
MSDNLYDVPSAVIVVVLVATDGISIPISELASVTFAIVVASGALPNTKTPAQA